MINKQKNVPFYIQIYDELKKKILNNEYKNGEFLPSERVLSDMFRVERATTRRALELLVKENLLMKIPGAGTKVIYNSQDKDLLQPVTITNSIAFILPGNTSDKITQPFVAELFYNLEKECKKQSYNLFYTVLQSDEDLPDIILQKNVKGIIWVSRIEENFIFKAKQLDIPSVLISNYIDGFASILTDNIGGSCQAVEHLIKLGHKKIYFINGIKEYLNAIERLEGYRRALDNAGIEFSEKYVKNGDWTFESGYVVMKEFLQHTHRPTAIYAANDMMALGAIKAINEHRLQVPDDISVIGFDNIEQCKYSTPSLTTVCANADLIASLAIKYLNELISNFDTPAIKILIPTQRIIRESTKQVI